MWRKRHGLGKHFIEEQSRDDHEVEQYNKQDHHERKPSELTGLFALARAILGRDTKHLDGIQIVKVRIVKHKHLTEGTANPRLNYALAT